MRSELELGLNGARELQAQLRDGQRREEDLRAKNAALSAKSTDALLAAKSGRNKADFDWRYECEVRIVL